MLMRRQLFFLATLIVLSTLLCSAIWASADLAMLDPSARPDTRFGPHYVLALDVALRGLSEEELCHTYPLDKDGNLQLTVGDASIDKIAVQGLTVDQARDKIKRSLAKYYAVDPEVRVGIARIPRIKVTVNGAVFRQGSVVLTDGSRLQDAFAESSYQPDADLERIAIARLEKDGTRTTLHPDFGQAARGSTEERHNPLLQNGDVITVPLSIAPPAIKRFQIVGAARREGRFVLKPGMTVRDALAEAQGLLPTADAENIRVVRQSGERMVVSAARVQQNLPTDNLKLQEDDYIFIDRKDTGQVYSISGAVVNPLTFEFKGKPTLKQALAECGGFRPEADLGKLVLMRNALRDPNKSQGVVIDYAKLARGDSPDIPLQPGDWVQVPVKKHQQSPLLQIGLFFLRRFLPF